MPIDFAAIAARFDAAFATQLRNAMFAQRLIAPALERRRAAGRTVELATRQFPIVRFYNGAVTLWLEPGQRAILTLSPPPPSFGEHLARGGLGFLTGLGLAAEPLRGDSQETVIPRLLAAAGRAVAEIEASVRRFATPRPEMFDPDRRTASDLFGLAGLAFRALAQASRKGGEIKRLADQLRGTLDVLGVPRPAPPSLRWAPPTAAAPEPQGRSLAEQLDAAAFSLLGAIVIVGVLPRMLGVLLEGVALRVRIVLLDEFEAIERLVLDLRASAYEMVFAGLVGLADRGVRLVLGGQEVVAANVSFTLRLWTAIGTELALGIRDFVLHFADYLRDWTRLLAALGPLFDALIRFDLTELLRSKIGRWVGVIPSFTLGDLLDSEGLRVNIALRDRLLGLIDVAATASLSPLVPESVGEKLEQARRLVLALFPGATLPSWALGTLLVGPPRISLPAEAAPLVFRSEFPDLAETLFGGGRAEQLAGVVDRVGTGMRAGVGRALDATASGLDSLAGEFARGAARAADLRAGGRLAQIGPQATELAGRVFGPEVARERAALARQPVDPLAAAFETWLADGGFFVVGDVIDGYVTGLAQHWREQVAEGTELTAPVTPTSPHILLRRATVGRVLLPRLTLRAARGRVLDEALADAVAAHFAAAVREAYGSGRQRLRELAESAGR